MMRLFTIFLAYTLIFMGFFCNSCSKSFPTRSVLSSHYKRYHRNPIPDNPQVQERYHTKLNGSSCTPFEVPHADWLMFSDTL